MKIKIIATTDIHGSILATNYTSRDNVEDYGLSKIATAIKQYKQDFDHVILVDNGDSFQGSPLISYAIDNNLENPITKVFNNLSYNFINLGNHDFNFGEKVLLEFVNKNKAKLLTSNILYKQKPLGKTRIVNIANKKIAFVGVCTHYIPNWENPKNIENFEFLDALKTLEKEVFKVKDKVDFVVGLYHGGLEIDPKTKLASEKLTGENQAYKMCDIENLDILVTGHQHRSFIKNIKDTLVSQSTFKAKEFVAVDLDLISGEKAAKVISSENYKEDPAVVSSLSKLEQETQKWLDQPLGEILDYNLLVKDEFLARLNKHPLVSFLNQVQLDLSGADISATSLFNGVKGFSEKITMRDLVATYLFPNTLLIKEISGKDLKAAIEVSLAYFDLDENNEFCVSDEFLHPKPQHYNYDMYDNISYVGNISKPEGQRLEKIEFQGKPVSDKDTFSFVINNYRAMGSGNYEMIANSKTIKEIPIEITEVIKDYLLNNSPVKINHQDNIKIIK